MSIHFSEVGHSSTSFHRHFARSERMVGDPEVKAIRTQKADFMYAKERRRGFWGFGAV